MHLARDKWNDKSFARMNRTRENVLLEKIQRGKIKMFGGSEIETTPITKKERERERERRDRVRAIRKLVRTSTT